jgi:hypothetical protein
VESTIQIAPKNINNIPKIKVPIESKDISEKNIINSNNEERHKTDNNKNNKIIDFNNYESEKNRNKNFSVISYKIERFKQLKKNAQKAKEESSYFNEINNLIKKIKEKRDNKNKENEDKQIFKTNIKKISKQK